MQQTTLPTASGDESNALWDPEEAIELWKYFGGIGSADKNTMVTVESLLLGISATIIGYVVTNLGFQSLSVTQPIKGLCLALLGLVISGVASYVALLYGGYSNWNWAKADAIARAQAKRHPKWNELLPKNFQKEPAGKPSFFCAIALYLGEPSDPTKQLAPIFGLYAGLAVVAAIFHLAILLLSAASLKR